MRVGKDGKETFLITATKAGAHAAIDETVRVAKYELVEVGEVRAPAAFKTTLKARRP